MGDFLGRRNLTADDVHVITNLFHILLGFDGITARLPDA